MRYSIIKKVRIAFVASLLFIFIISYLSYTSISKLIQTSGMVNHTQYIINNLSQLHATIREAETSQRGFLLTSDSLFLENYEVARQKTNVLQQDLDSLFKTNPSRYETYLTLELLIEKRFQRLDEILQNFSNNKPYNLEASSQTMQEVKKIIQALQEDEYRLLALRSGREQHYASRALWFILLFVFIILFLMLVAFFRIRRDVKKRLLAEKVLEENNQQLENQVEERTREISRNEERYRFMAESIPHIVWSAKPEGDFDFYSRQWSDYSGAGIEETLGWGWTNYIHPDDLQYTIETWKNMLQSQTEQRIEHRLLGKDGVYRWMQTHAVPYINEEGKLTKWFGTTTLIDDEIKAKEAARQQEQLLQDITDALPVCISFMDKNYRYQFVNKTYEKWFNIPQAEMKNKYAWEVIGETGFEKIKGYAEQVLSGKTVNATLETFYPNLGKRHIKFNLIPRYENSKVIGIYALIDDVTGLKNTENNLRNALLETEAKNLELNRINQILDDFVSMAAHDLKSPVSNLKLSLFLIDKLTDPLEKVKIIDHLDKSVKRLDKTLSGLLEIVEVQHVKGAKVTDCLFSSVLEEVMVNLKDLLRDCGGEIISHFEEAPSIRYIRPYLISIMHNLVSNAIKYRSPKRKLLIELSTAIDGNYIIFTCKDNGTGIDLEKAGNKLFKPFKRFTTEVEGTGVGLHLIKSIIERNGGHITVDSQIDTGSVFKCFLKNI